MLEDFEGLLKIIVGMQAFIIIAFITQFISNLTIITQLPQIKRACENMNCEPEEDEEDNEENQHKKEELSKIRFVVYIILFFIFALVLFSTILR